ncbi:MAG: flagellar brake protein [Desulfovibrionaceae bacterium]|jgi:c-di-GMP-binding flagellar brake protein YcgR|nr:flagellar brake protein [Desulfovibrionaceae bacterium]
MATNPSPPQTLPRPVIEVGARAIVEPQGVGDRFLSRFLGWDAERFVAMRPPADLELRDHLQPGKPLIVRYLQHGGQVVGFESRVQGIVHKPQKILFIDYPDTAQAVSLRHRNRVSSFLPSTLVADGREVPGSVVNISSGGCRFVVKPGSEADAHGLAEGAEAFLLSRLFALEADLQVNCRIMAVRRAADRVVLGLRFLDLEPEVETLLERYVDEVSTYLGLAGAECGES